jgi:MYXO-CTERM domain-containing protein
VRRAAPAAWLGLAAVLAAGTAEARFRRPYEAALSFNYGFDHAGGGCTDWNCGGRCYDGHTGTDFPLAMGTLVLAPAAGRVIAVNDGCADWGYLGNTCGGRCGNYVQLQHDDGTTTLFCHMQNGSLRVGNGDHVACGQALGRSASSGNSTGPHLHLGWRSGGANQDPYAGPCSRATSQWVDQNGYWDAPSTRCECTPSPEACNGADDDCDGTVDEDLSRSCGTDVGPCRSGTQTCRGGDWGACAGEIPPETERCNSIDDDCDGAADDELSRSCGTDEGECVAGRETCADGAWGVCAGEVPPEPETCNERDDDCDGETDEQHVCELEELAFQGDALDGRTSTDVDGDGRADACGRAAGEVRCHLASGRGFEVLVLGPPLSDAAGWDAAPYGTTLRFGDLDGDGRDDLCARGADGVQCWRSTGGSFGARIAGPALTDADGWDRPERYATIRLTDIDGDGRADLCARDARGFACWPSRGDGFGSPLRLAELADEDGWTEVARFGTLRTGDIDGDGRDDLCARDATGVRCFVRDRRGLATIIDGPAWSDAAGWDDFCAWSTIRLADVDGDGRDDLCARGAEGVTCRLSEGVRFGATVVGPPLTDADGWNAWERCSTIRFGDVDGDGAADLCARGAAGVDCWAWDGTGFGRRLAGPPLGDDAGWREPRYYRTLRLADVTGDGRADLCARTADGVRCWVADGAGFPTTLLGPPWSDAAGWDAPAYYATIRIGGMPRGAPVPGGAAGGCGCRAVGATDDAGPLPPAALLALVLAARLRRRRANSQQPRPVQLSCHRWSRASTAIGSKPSARVSGFSAPRRFCSSAVRRVGSSRSARPSGSKRRSSERAVPAALAAVSRPSSRASHDGSGSRITSRVARARGSAADSVPNTMRRNAASSPNTPTAGGAKRCAVSCRMRGTATFHCAPRTAMPPSASWPATRTNSPRRFSAISPKARPWGPKA